MRSQLWLLAAWGRLASANGLLGQKLDHPVDVSHLLPRETQASAPDGANGWTPKPTEGPSLELVRRSQRWANLKRQTSENTWLNDKTCGWFSEERCKSLPPCIPCSTCAPLIVPAQLPHLLVRLRKPARPTGIRLSIALPLGMRTHSPPSLRYASTIERSRMEHASHMAQRPGAGEF